MKNVQSAAKLLEISMWIQLAILALVAVPVLAFAGAALYFIFG